MSSNSKDETGAFIMIVAFICAALMALAIFIAAILIFAAFVLTVLAIFAWNKPRRIGKIVILPEEARGFVFRGIAGAFLIPVFLAFTTLFFDLNIDWHFLPHFMLAGYVGGSLGLEILFAQEEQQNAAPVFTPVQPAVAPPSRPRALPPAEAAPFRYASWDDEEEQGR